MIKNVLILFIAISLFPKTGIFSQSTRNSTVTNQSFIKGVDVSTLIQIEDNGGVFKENGIIKDPLEIFKSHGLNYVRLKLWHTPNGGYNNLQRVLSAAQRIKNNGLDFLLDIHFSDTWADPANQTKPAAWNGLSFQTLKDSVYNYTKDVITTLKIHNVLPDIVQIGNEIICGMLWDDGRICDQYNTPQQWSNFAELLKEGIRGIEENIDTNDTVKILIHIDRGGDNAVARWFYDGLLGQGVVFDLIGLSYYPWWHGTFTDLQNNLNDLAQHYDKEIVIVETAYPWTLDWFDNTNNIVGNLSQLLAGYPATVDGQKHYLSDLITLANNTINNKCIGVFYWEPEWVSTPTFGSPWENLALFDFTGNLLNSISAFDSTLTEVPVKNITANTFELLQNYPNPFNPSTKISWQSPVGSWQTLKVYNILGKEITTLVDAYREAGKYEITFNATDLTSGIYFYKLNIGAFYQLRKMTLIK